MKKLVFLIVAAVLVGGASLTGVNNIDGDVLHTMQNAWLIAESENSGDTQTDALGVTERTKKIVDALIAANANEEDQISVLAIPPRWNAIRFRSIGITDGATVTHQIYLGALGRGLDCELTYAGQLAWTIGTQQSIYDQIAFTSGGSYEPKPGNIVTGNDSGKTAVVVSFILTSGAWVDSDAAGTITYKSASGAFTSGETIRIVNPRGETQANVLTHTSSDLIDFELADTLTVTAATGTWSTVSPADDTNAEAEIDVKGADYMVIVTSATSVDSKLLIKGY